MVDIKRKAIIFFILAFVLAVVASGIVVNEWRNIRASWGETVRVAIANKDILPYTKITSDLISWTDMPRQFVTDTFISDEEALKKSITIVDVKKGDFFTKNVTRNQSELSPFERIVWLNISSNVFLDQIVAPGDRVDLIITHQDQQNVVTERLFSNIPVIQREPLDQGKFAIKVVLPLNDAEKLIYYQNTANQIRVLLSNQVESTTNASNGEEEPANPNQGTKEVQGGGKP